MKCTAPAPESFAPAENKINLRLNICCKDIQAVSVDINCALNSVLQQRREINSLQEADRQQQVLPENWVLPSVIAVVPPSERRGQT